ncbi:MAG TPA: putative glycoside hydrolase, partial [Gaiellaceae bacterium]|nr:putative glycoside hydrolase [Gaiellaceae bacterium]
YPSHYRPGEFNLADPNAVPGTTVAKSLADFQAQLAGEQATIIPWLQDFSLGRTYTPADVAAEIQAARTFHTGGFMLWNAAGVYTAQELHPGPTPPPLPRLTLPTI